VGVRLAVQFLNHWHDTNLGALGKDPGWDVIHHRFDWQNIALEALYWAKTGREPRHLPPDWQPTEDDLRIVWYNQQNPELGVIALWPAHHDPNVPATDTAMVMAEDYLHFTIVPRTEPMASDLVYEFAFRAGTSPMAPWARTLTFNPTELPTNLDPGMIRSPGAKRGDPPREIPIWKD